MVVGGCTFGGFGYMSVSTQSTLDRLTPTHNDAFRILLGVAPAHIHVRYLATFCIAAGSYASLGLVIAWCKYPTPVVMVLFRSPLPYLIPHIIQGEGNDTDQ